MDPFLGEIIMFGGNFAPRGWALCDGQLLPISQYSALFSILGTTYGGDGRTTFALPDLRGRTPIHAGTGPGLSNRKLGSRGGSEYNILNTNQLPSHTHNGMGLVANTGVVVGVNEDDGDSDEPAGRVLGIAASGTPYNSSPADSALGGVTATTTIGGSTAPTGANQSINNMPPFETVNYIIALQGIFPSRS
ncbi:phage tail protein [Sungkyunkwania multivorans]|uniref:Phage tail protein n=1 Tax=Sungkyunkwania multivorans TaxID=1173618 RepID=A0ABW3CW09_9FLAO